MIEISNYPIGMSIFLHDLAAIMVGIDRRGLREQGGTVGSTMNSTQRETPGSPRAARRCSSVEREAR